MDLASRIGGLVTRSVLAMVGGYAVTAVCVVELDLVLGALALIVLPSTLAGGYLRAIRPHASEG